MNATVFRLLCRVVGGQDSSALDECMAAQQLQALFDMARMQGLLPALAVRCNEHPLAWRTLGKANSEVLNQALRDNTLCNMSISGQALKIARALNRADITPLFLKGTARLLTAAGENLGFRKQVDIDLLVPPAQLKAAGDVFLADGYRFQQFSGSALSAQNTLADTSRAITLSAAHHHLPPLVKTGYATTVELHRHFLPKRFQRRNPLQPLFKSAQPCETLGATFLVPSSEYQLIHLILGKLVNDGHFARRSFPIREACDLIDILESDSTSIDLQLLAQHCGKKFGLFHALVAELMGYRSRLKITGGRSAANYIGMMQKRFHSRAMRILLDSNARIEYLSHELAYSPGKLPDYVSRVISAP